MSSTPALTVRGSSLLVAESQDHVSEEKDTSMPQGHRPLCLAIIICNEVIEDKRSNNKTLVSLFSRIGTKSIPCVHPRMFVMASLTDGHGTVPLVFRIVHLATQEHVVELRAEASFASPMDVSDVVLEFRNLPLKKEGSYAVEVLADGELLGMRRLYVELVKEDEEEDG
jgi:hypothetical protein